MSARRSIVTVLLAGVVALTAAGAATGGGRTLRPTLVIAAPAGAIGDLVTATLQHWPAGLVTVSVCGNSAWRGSPDCDLHAAFTVNLPAGGATEVRVPIVRPPVDCPCVVRAATLTNATVRTAPIAIAGLAPGRGPAPPAVSVAAAGLAVRARVVDGDSSWTEAFGVGATRTIRVTLHNRGASATPPLRVTGAVGREVDRGEAFASRRIAPLGAGARRTIAIPVELSTPAFGDYVVFGTVYGLDAPAHFRADTDADPWALELAVPVLVLLLARALRRKERRRSVAEEVDATPESVSAPFPECSPEVGGGDEERYGSPSYDPHDRQSQDTASHAAASLV